MHEQHAILAIAGNARDREQFGFDQVGGPPHNVSYGETQMPKGVVVDIPHQLGRAEARQRLQRGFGRIREQFGTGVLAVEEKWLGDRLEFSAKALGQSVVGRLEVLEKTVHIELDLPWALAMLAERLQGRVTRAAVLLLEKK